MILELLFLFAAFILAYVIGAIPTGLIIGLRFKGIDIREHGSGNIGFTNVLRIMGKRYGIPVLIIDVGKAALVILLLTKFAQPSAFPEEVIKVTFGLAVMLGNLFNVFMGFKGGKGVATALGVFLALAPIPVLISLFAFLAILAITKYVSIGSIFAAITLPFSVIIFMGFGVTAALSIVIALFVIIKHRSNIKRLLTGEEHQITKSGE